MIRIDGKRWEVKGFTLNFEPRGAKIDQKTNFNSSCLQIVHQLNFMEPLKGVNRLQFDDDLLFNNYISLESTNLITLIGDNQGELSQNRLKDA